MMRSLVRLCLLAVPLGLAFALAPSPAPACPFCSENRGPTLVGGFDEAAFVVVGTFTNPRFDQKGGLENAASDFVIDLVLKDHEFVHGKKMVTLPKYVPDQKHKYLIFADVFKGTVDPYKGVQLQPNGDMVAYLTKALALVKDKATPGERLRHCFDYLQSPELDVSLDAYREFAKADYAEYKDMARKLPADKIADWLQDPKTPPFRFGLYASLLGHCGDPAKHGKLLRSLVDDPEKRNSSGIDGILAAYLMLQPKEGWVFLQSVVADPKQDFNLRYAGLRTLRFYYDNRNDLFTKDQVVAGVALTLQHGDMADFGIEDLRKWHRWDQADQVLDLYGKKSHDMPVIRRAILRYALQCPPSQKRAAAFVQDMRRQNPDWVSDAEELLRLETPAEEPAKKK